MGATEELWPDAFDKEAHRKRFAQVQRRGAYRTASEPPVMVIARVIPAALPTTERKTIYSRKGENLKEVVVRVDRQRTLTEWQLSWQNKPRGRWTARFIDDLDLWLNRKQGKIH